MKMDTREDRVFAQFQKVCQKVWLSSKSMSDYITLKKCSTQYVAHFMWLTKSLKIGEYATICSTLYVLPVKTHRPKVVGGKAHCICANKLSLHYNLMTLFFCTFFQRPKNKEHKKQNNYVSGMVKGRCGLALFFFFFFGRLSHWSVLASYLPCVLGYQVNMGQYRNFQEV